MNKEKEEKEIIDKTSRFVKETLAHAEGGHDWWHIYRVWLNAKNIARHESADTLAVELGALLHDIADSKFYDGDEEIGPRKARDFLLSLGVSGRVVDHVEKIIANISFKGENHNQQFKSPELDVVQDADRLDALGAMGIARAFNYGGYAGRELYNPSIRPVVNMTKDQYKKNVGTTINHFYEKLLLLKDKMNTGTGRRLAERRHVFLLKYLDEFYAEWDGRH